VSNKRFPHYMRPTKGGKWPRSIVTVDVTGGTSSYHGSPVDYEESLKTWHCRLHERVDSVYGPQHGISGSTKVQFWNYLRSVSTYAGPLWIVSYGACRAWHLLGVWEGIEDGEIIIAESNQSRIARSSVLRDMRGMDSCWSSEWWIWIDIRNYGVDCPTGVSPGADRVAWLSAAMLSVTRAVNSTKLGSLRPTAGSQALHGFRCSYYKGGIYAGAGRQTDEIERAAYYGGRCECCFTGIANSTIVSGDFASQYCRLCRDNGIPVRCVSYTRSAGNETVPTYSSVSSCIADVDIETDEAAYPYRRSTNAARQPRNPRCGESSPVSYGDTDIIYPVGRFRTVLCGPELKDAVDHGRVRRWHTWSQYELQPALTDYAKAILALRASCENENDVVGVQLAKRLGNCLPGKFGERMSRWVYAPNAACDIEYGEWYAADADGELRRFRAIAGVVHRQEREEWSEEAVPAIAAWITSLGRKVLLDHIRTAGWRHVYYYDTDSLFVDEHGWANLAGADFLYCADGPYLREIGRANNAAFYGIKHYSFGNRNVCAGMPYSGSHAYADGHSYIHVPTPAEFARKGDRPSERGRVTKIYRRVEYRHGTVGPDGRVSPLVVEEW
jgi:hypothetical protein